jgi:O-antigen ligase
MTTKNSERPRSPHDLSDLPFGGAATVFLGRKLAFYTTVAVSGLAVGWALVRLPLLQVVGAFAGLAFVITVLVKPYWGLLFYTVLFMLRLGEVYPVLAALRLERLVGVLTLAGLFFSQHRREGSLFLDGTRQTKLFLAFLLCVLLSVPLAFWRGAAVEGLVDMVRIFAFYIMVVHLVDTRPRLKIFIWIYCLSIVWLGSTSLHNYLTGHAEFAQGIDRASGTTSAQGNANELGTTMACSFPLFLLLSMNRSVGKKRFLIALGGLALLVTMALTGSRASLLGFLAGLMTLWWRSRRRVLLAVLGLVALVLGYSILPEQYKQRYATITGVELEQVRSQGRDSESRMQTWMTGLRMVSQRPIFGVGIACFGSANGALTGNFLSSHSLYIQVLAELGLVGATVFFMFLVEMLRLNRKTRRRLVESGKEWEFERSLLDGVFAGLIVLLVSGVFGHSLMRRTWYLYGAIGLAVLRLYLQGSPLVSRTHPNPEESR